MKKLTKVLTLVFSLMMALVLVACKTTTAAKTTASTTTEEVQYVKCNHQAFIEAKDDTPVEIEAYVQACQGWWDNKITIYLQDEDGGYFAYNVLCSETDAAKLTAGTKIRIKGYKTTWQGEMEIAEGATFEFVESKKYVAEAFDVTTLLGTDTLINHQNELVSFKGMVVTSAPTYKWDNSGKQGDDLYFGVRVLGTETSYTFTVESYLCGATTDVYKAVEALKVGDIINMEGFCYWYDGINPHITKVENAVYTHEQFVNAEDDTEVVIITNIQAFQGWWDNTITLYLQDATGGYFAYNVVCPEAKKDSIVKGAQIAIHGYKTTWQGEMEIAGGATFEILTGESYVAEAFNVTSLLGTDDLIKHQNEYVAFKNAEVTGAATYKWDNSGKQGDDLYFKVKFAGVEYTFTVESYLCDATTDVYKVVEALKVGDMIDLEGFCYWYDGINPHITKVTHIPE